VLHIISLLDRVGSKGGAIGEIAPLKSYESNFVHHDFVQLRKKHSQFKAILTSIVLSRTVARKSSLGRLYVRVGGLYVCAGGLDIEI